MIDDCQCKLVFYFLITHLSATHSVPLHWTIIVFHLDVRILGDRYNLGVMYFNSSYVYCISISLYYAVHSPTQLPPPGVLYKKESLTGILVVLANLFYYMETTIHM